jgi:hypothetical protein
MDNSDILLSENCKNAGNFKTRIIFIFARCRRSMLTPQRASVRKAGVFREKELSNVPYLASERDLVQ